MFVKIAKLAVTTAVGIGAAKIIKTIITDNVTPEKAIDHITVIAGTLAIAGMVAEASKRFTDSKIDEAVEAFNTHVLPKFKK